MERSEMFEQRVRVMQIIKASLMMGVLGFAVVAMVLSRPPKELDALRVWLMASFGGLMILLRLVVPSHIAGMALKRIVAGTWQPSIGQAPPPNTDEERLLIVYQIQMIIGSALLEGGVFGNLFACMTAGHIVNWIFAGILFVGLAIDFPTQASVERWIESKLAWIKDERRLAA